MTYYKFKTNQYIDACLKPDLKSTPLYNELITLGAFLGDLPRRTHLSQLNLIKGYRLNLSFYDISKSIDILTKATRFLIKLKKRPNYTFILVANLPGNKTELVNEFQKIKHRQVQFFTSNSWPPGYISKTGRGLSKVLVVDDITLNKVPYQEAVRAKIPVVAFLSPACNLNGVDYPVALNLKNNNIWFVNYCKALLQNKKALLPKKKTSQKKKKKKTSLKIKQTLLTNKKVR